MELPRVSKKLCLLAILVFLCLIITCNLLLTFWIITSVRLNFNGKYDTLTPSLSLNYMISTPTRARQSVHCHKWNQDRWDNLRDGQSLRQAGLVIVNGLWCVLSCWSNVVLISDQFLPILCWPGAAGGEVSDSDQRWEQLHHRGQVDRQEQHGDHRRHIHYHRHPRRGDPVCGWE